MKSIALATGVVAVLMAVGAPATDSPVPSVPSPEVLREIGKIQEQLGGSIVKGSELESLAPPPPAKSPVSVTVLRDAAWDLEKSAHRLELADLYRQADELRAVAEDFRQEARDLKSAAEKPE